MPRTASVQTLVTLAETNPTAAALREFEQGRRTVRSEVAALPAGTSPERRREVEDSALRPLRDRVEGAVNDTRRQLADADRAARDILETPTVDTREATRIERDRDRWRRMSERLDAGGSPADLVSEAWNDVEGLAVLVRELPSRLQTDRTRSATATSRSVREALDRAAAAERPGGWLVERAERRLSALLTGDEGDRLAGRYDRADAVEIVEADLTRAGSVLSERDSGARLAAALGSSTVRVDVEGRRREAGMPALLTSAAA